MYRESIYSGFTFKNDLFHWTDSKILEVVQTVLSLTEDAEFYSFESHP